MKLSRCICEIFTFVQMGSSLSRVEVLPFDNGQQAFATFHVAECNCFKAEDKGKLLQAIESAFGSHAAFDVVMKTLLETVSAGGSGGDVTQLLRKGSSKAVVQGV